MARQNSLITFTGKLGDLIGYYRNGRYFLRRMPELVRQTTATHKSALRFGIASRKGALIRSAICSELDVCCDSGYVNRLTSVLIPRRGKGSSNGTIESFRFNQQTGIDQFFAVTPLFPADGQLHIPAQTLPRLKGIDTVEIKVISSCIDFTTQQVVDTKVITAVFDPGQPFTGITLFTPSPEQLPTNGTLVVTLQVRCIKDGRPSGDRKRQAADIIAVIAPQVEPQIQPQNCPIMYQPAYRHHEMRQAKIRASNAYAYVPVEVNLRE